MDMSEFIHGAAPMIQSAGSTAVTGGSGSGAGAALAGAAIDTGVQMFTKDWEMRKQHGYSTQEQNHAYELQQLAQRNAAMNTVEGYKMAGLSPALAANGSFAPAPAINAPSKVNASGINPRIAEQTSLALLQSQIELNKSQAEKNSAEAGLVGEQSKTQGITNARMTQEDLTARTNAQVMIKNLLQSDAVKKNPDLEAAYEAMLEAANSAQFNLGTIRGNQEYISLIAQGNKAAIDRVKADYENMVLDYYTQVGKPELDINLLRLEIGKTSADILQAAANMALAYSNIELNGSKAADLEASAADHLASASLSYSKDFAKQFKTGDYQSLGINAGMQIISGASSGLGFGAAGRILGAGSKAAGAAKNIGTKTLKSGKAVQSKTAYNAGKKLKDAKILSPEEIRQRWAKAFPQYTHGQ